MSLSNSNCYDVYNINSVIVKSSSIYISEVLCHLINNCFSTGYFPDKLKVTKVIPVFKKGERNSASNYRPISIVPTLSKVLEKLISLQIVEYLDANQLLSKSQFGFRKNHSTVDAVMSFVQSCLEGKENKLFVGAKFFDLSKAFDTVNHSTLLLKLKWLGFSQSAILLIKSYLDNRIQCVLFKGCFSDFKSVCNGVPQGSILGPLLFILYINDLPSILNSEILSCYLYADDICLTVSSIVQNVADISCLFKSDLLLQWCYSNSLSMNMTKTQELNILYDHNQATESVKFLGIYLQNDLSWKSHISYVLAKVNRGLFMIRKLSSSVSYEILLSVYYGYIHSHISYGAIIWAKSSYSNSLFIAQKKAIRLISKVPYRFSCRELFIKLGILTLPCIYIFQCLLYVKKNLTSFRLISDVHSYNTRHCTDIMRDYCSYSKTLHSFKSISVRLFNKLSEDVRNLNDSKFRIVIKEFLTSNCFYSVEEYLSYNF
jgi:hypothetical protein